MLKSIALVVTATTLAAFSTVHAQSSAAAELDLRSSVSFSPCRRRRTAHRQGKTGNVNPVGRRSQRPRG